MESIFDDKMVDHPPHYKSNTGMEVIDVIEAFTADLTGIEAADTANLIKYACRWKNKNGVLDLKKLVWYARHLIRYVEKMERRQHDFSLAEIAANNALSAVDKANAATAEAVITPKHCPYQNKENN